MFSNNISKFPEYKSWRAMIDRCMREHSPGYHRYGGRGIKICDSWLESFENFYKDMGQRPTPDHSIERKDNNGNYEPDNCVWATPKEQAYNRCDNIVIKTPEGDVNSEQASKIFNLKKYTMYTRISRNVPLEQPLSEYNRLYNYKGQMLTSSQLSKLTSVPISLIRSRLASGLPVEKAVEMEVQQPPTHEYDGKFYTVKELCDKFNVKDYNLRHHLNKGRNVKEALRIMKAIL